MKIPSKWLKNGSIPRGSIYLLTWTNSVRASKIMHDNFLNLKKKTPWLPGANNIFQMPAPNRGEINCQHKFNTMWKSPEEGSIDRFEGNWSWMSFCQSNYWKEQPQSLSSYAVATAWGKGGSWSPLILEKDFPRSMISADKEQPKVCRMLFRETKALIPISLWLAFPYRSGRTDLRRNRDRMKPWRKSDCHQWQPVLRRIYH